MMGRRKNLRRAAVVGIVMIAVAAAVVLPLRLAPSKPSTATGTEGGGTRTSTAGAAAAGAPASPLPPGIPLRVVGNRLVDSAGAGVILHGANISGTESACAQNWTADPFAGQPEDDPRTIAAMRSWRLNAVRIPLNEDCWLGINGVRIGGASYRRPVVSMAHDYEQAGFYVILDLHWSAPGTQRALGQNAAPDADHSSHFWQSVASTFRGEGRVLFDLFNEPFFYWIAPGGPDEWSCLWNGCTITQYVTGGSPYTRTTPWTSAGFTQLIRVIRGTGATNVILASGVNWARDLSGWLAHRPPDANLAASWHAYTSANPSLRSECAASWCWNQVVAPMLKSVPVVVGETGDSSAGPVSFLPGFLPWADEHGVGYLAWTWNAWKNPDDVLVVDMRSGAPTSGEGAYVRNHLLHG